MKGVVGGLILRGMGCRVIGNAKTTELFVWSINGPKRFGFNEFSSDVVGQIEVTKKPAGLAPCGLSGLHRMTLGVCPFNPFIPPPRGKEEEIERREEEATKEKK
ncbi:hypothetical protein J9B06_16010, partial [Klebsiella pneumoniae]